MGIISFLHHEYNVLDHVKKKSHAREVVHDHANHHDHDKENRHKLGLEAEGPHFKIDGKKFNIYSGEIHYFRVHPEYWEHRLGQLAASGLNTVSFYVPWNFHETEETKFNFDGPRDLRRFIKIAEKLHLHVLIRVGPYICAEWEWGGLPAWLLKNDNLKIRSNTPNFMDPVRKWLNRLVEEIVDLQERFDLKRPHLDLQILQF